MSQVNHHQSGIGYWRSLEQLADTPEVRDLLAKEFPGYDPTQMATGGAPSRRRFLKLMGASMALAGVTLTGCRRWPEEKLVPYSTNPSGRVPGEMEHFATNWELGGVAQALLVASFDGRPIKVEGNPDHPASATIKGKQGSADAWAQASVLEMYDPQRSRVVVDHRRGERAASTWETFTAFANQHFGQMKGGGNGLAFLSEASASPSVADVRKRIVAAFPQAKWYEYEPLSGDAALEGSRAAFGKSLRSVFNLAKADVVLSLDADLLGFHPNHIRHAADWAERRRGAEKGEMNRVYMAETTYTITGSVADDRVAVDPSRIAAIAQAIAMKIGVTGGQAYSILSEKERAFVDRASADLLAAKGAAVVAVGPAVAPAVHALAHAINQQLGAVGNTVTLIDDPAGDRPTHIAAIADLANAMKAGSIGTLVILGGNPVYDAPADLNFGELIKNKVGVSIHLGLYDDETSVACTWHLPRAHYLEAWGDARAWDGTVGVTQPIIEPLFGGRSPIELLALVAGEKVTAGEEIVRRTWREQILKTAGGDVDAAWRKVLHDGFLVDSASPAVTATPNAAVASAPALAVAAPQPGTFFLKFEPDSHTYDGRFANNGWLQETHDPLTKLIWDNAALISVKNAKDLGLKNGDVIKIEGKDGWIEVAAYIMPGQPVGVISLSLGYFRTIEQMAVAHRLGFPSYTMRRSNNPWVVPNLKVTATGQHYKLVMTHLHHLIDEVGVVGREDRIGAKGQTGKVVREATLAEYKANPKAPHDGNHGSQRLQLFDPPIRDSFGHPHRWGMTVDMNTCIGCNACVVACTAENNIPVVGKDQADMHREMHWIRIDRYFKGSLESAEEVDVIHQPMLCVHCENAPCEQVCPVAATMHDTEGINTMVYNRCIGTRYCANNCPYKVRRFNYFDWHAKPPRKSTGVLHPGMPDTQQQAVDPVRRMQYNPDVTVRMRGVMEKCTYCTQRIQRTKISKRNHAVATGKPDDARVLDGEVLTACQQACPTQAIVFGDLNDKTAKVTQLQNEKNYPRVYEVLGDLNTRARTLHLAKIRNPSEAHHGGGGAAPKHAAVTEQTTTTPESVG